MPDALKAQSVITFSHLQIIAVSLKEENEWVTLPLISSANVFRRRLGEGKDVNVFDHVFDHA